MKRMIIVAAAGLCLAACGNQNGSPKTTDATAATPAEETKPAEQAASGDKGIGKFTNVEIAAKLDDNMAEQGHKIYDLKCGSCHKLSEEKLVGPGWKNVTVRHKPEWILNFITNTDEMLNKDDKAKQQLEICLVRMPNQNLSDDDARHLLEYMRKNDGVK